MHDNVEKAAQRTADRKEKTRNQNIAPWHCLQPQKQAHYLHGSTKPHAATGITGQQMSTVELIWERCIHFV